MISTTGSRRATIEDLLAAARSGLIRVRPRDAAAVARDGGPIIDIRSDRQRERGGLVPGAHHVPRNVLEWRFDASREYCDPILVRVPGPLVLMCDEGYQSSLAAATLQRIGVGRATDLIGGFQAWRAEGLPVLSA